MPGIKSPEDRPFFRTLVQLIIGLLFISISATVTPSSVSGVLWPTVALVAGLIVVVRPLVAAVATMRTNLPRRERLFIGLIDPRGIVAASTAATFAAPLTDQGIVGADDLLPATFLVIVGTVTIYGLAAAPAARLWASQRQPTSRLPKASRRRRPEDLDRPGDDANHNNERHRRRHPIYNQVKTQSCLICMPRACVRDSHLPHTIRRSVPDLQPGREVNEGGRRPHVTTRRGHPPFPWRHRL